MAAASRSLTAAVTIGRVGGRAVHAANLFSFSCAGWHHHTSKESKITLELRFQQPLPQPITVIVYSLFDSFALISADGKVDLKLG